MKWTPYDYARKTTPSCSTGWPLREAAGLFAKEGVGSILVSDGRGGYAGILTAKVIFSAIADGADLNNLAVGSLKLEPAVYVGKDASMDEVRRMFRESPSGRLLMTDAAGNVVGVLKKNNLDRFSIFHHVRHHVRKHVHSIGKVKSHVKHHVGRLLRKKP